LQRRKEMAQKAGFQKEVVPLKAEKLPAHRGQRKINQPQQKQAWGGRNTEEQQQSKNNAGGAL